MNPDVVIPLMLIGGPALYLFGYWGGMNFAYRKAAEYNAERRAGR